MSKKFVCLGGSKDPVGFCHYHKKSLSAKQLKSKECLSKQCNRLEKYDHPFWKNREFVKVKRKENKDKVRLEIKNMCRSELVKAIEYCQKCPKSSKEAIEYCSQCKYSKDCMAGIMDMIYDYLKTYENETFENYLSDSFVLINRTGYEALLRKAGYNGTR